MRQAFESFLQKLIQIPKLLSDYLLVVLGFVPQPNLRTLPIQLLLFIMSSNSNLNPIDFVTLNGFLRTLCVLESPLPPEAISQINQIGVALGNNQLDSLRELEAIAHQYPALKDQYETIVAELQANYQPVEMVRPRPRPDADIELQRLLDNTVLPTLTDPDPKSAAKQRRAQIDIMILPPT